MNSNVSEFYVGGTLWSNLEQRPQGKAHSSEQHCALLVLDYRASWPPVLRLFARGGGRRGWAPRGSHLRCRRCERTVVVFRPWFRPSIAVSAQRDAVFATPKPHRARVRRRRTRDLLFHAERAARFVSFIRVFRRSSFVKGCVCARGFVVPSAAPRLRDSAAPRLRGSSVAARLRGCAAARLRGCAAARLLRGCAAPPRLRGSAAARLRGCATPRIRGSAAPTAVSVSHARARRRRRRRPGAAYPPPPRRARACETGATTTTMTRAMTRARRVMTRARRAMTRARRVMTCAMTRTDGSLSLTRTGAAAAPPPTGRGVSAAAGRDVK